MIDQINALTGRRLAFTLLNMKVIFGVLIEAAADGFVVDAFFQEDTLFGDDRTKRIFILGHAVAFVHEWSNPQWQTTKGATS